VFPRSSAPTGSCCADGSAGVTFIYLHGDRGLLARRLAQRHPALHARSLLESQLAALEPPTPEEGAWTYDISLSPRAIVASLVERIGAE